ncbi:MAG: type I-C CRISPR-associated protein Cas8c/Csd1 [Rikenellaceae bacterium]
MKPKINNNLLCEATDYIEKSIGEEWHVGGFSNQEGAFVSISDGEGKLAQFIAAVLILENIELEQYRRCGETLKMYAVSPSSDGKLTATEFLQMEANAIVRNIEYACSYLNLEAVSLLPLVKLLEIHYQPLQFVKELLESLLVSKPLSKVVMSTLLRRGKYNPLLADLFRFHINKTNRYGYVGIYLDEKIDNIGYISGRILATMEYIASLSENREPLRLDYARFSTSPMLMFPKLDMIAKKYIYTVPQLGRQIYLKNLLDSLLDKAKDYQSTKRYLSDNDQVMFTIGYKHQTEYFADESFTSKFQILNAMRQPDMLS